MSKLFKNEDSDSEAELNINKDYANSYDNWRQKEELHKLKARYGEDVEILANSEEESSESSEDDEGVELPEQFEKSFYKTLACLKNKDPRIYNENVKFFEEQESNNAENGVQSKKNKEKALFLRDYERKIIVERGGKLSDSEYEDAEKQNIPLNPTYVQEQKELKESFKKALQDEEDNKEDVLLKPKSKSKEEAQMEEEDYKEWLKGQKESINEEVQKELKPLRDFWIDPNLDKNEKFLRDYILNKKFLDTESADVNLDYDQIAHNSDENLSEDERNINQQEEFEHKYNFRFEEPDQEFIKRYPRTLENSLRKKDTRRAQKRAEVKARKEQEKVKKQEELKQLKALKRKEIEEKIETLKEITGNDDVQFDIKDLEGDFDPDEYDKKMSQIFNDKYYAEEKDEMKPEFPEIDEELCVESTWDNYDPSIDQIVEEDVLYHDSPHCEDPDFNMDADYGGRNNLQYKLVESTKKRKKRRRSKFAEMISQEKPKFDPKKHPSYQKYYDQYYALDYEDMIGDLTCRFKYRKVEPNNYGLTIEEILMADDKELNKWCSLKRALQYKSEYEELKDAKRYKQKAANEALKHKILKSLYTTPVEEETETPATSTLQNPEEQCAKKKRKRKKIGLPNENKKLNQDETRNKEPKTEVEESTINEVNTEKPLKKKKEKLLRSTEEEKSPSFDTNNVSKADVELTNKKKRKLKQSTEEINETKTVQKKNKKRRKEHQNGIQNNECSTEHTDSVVMNADIQSSNTSNIKDIIGQSSKVQNENLSKHNELKNKNEKKNNIMKDETTLSKKEKRKQLFKKKFKNNKEKTKEVDQIASLSAERLKAYGLNPKKFKNKLKYMKKH